MMHIFCIANAGTSKYSSSNISCVSRLFDAANIFPSIFSSNGKCVFLLMLISLLRDIKFISISQFFLCHAIRFLFLCSFIFPYKPHNIASPTVVLPAPIMPDNFISPSNDSKSKYYSPYIDLKSLILIFLIFIIFFNIYFELLF